MTISGDYYLAWSIYFLAVVVAQWLLWRLMAGVKNRSVVTVAMLSVLALLITPAPLDDGQSYWVPAFMAAIMEGLDQGPDAVVPRLLPILIMMLVLLCLSLLIKLLKRSSKP